MSGRPVYIPPAKRKSGSNNNSKPQRFHGAFTGGFSAGYFNTVDTKEGWKPSNQKLKDQRLEDFMDEQDHEEWGGPTKVRQDYHPDTKDTTSSLRPGPEKKTESLDTLLRISAHRAIGSRLLRKLGWREEGKAAFVPMGRDEQVETKQEEDNDANLVLSRRRLKKIRLQTNRFKIPPPKLDDCGLGFEPHQDAPEFKAFRERKKQLAKERGSAGGSSSDVYRASALTEGNNGDQLSSGKGDNDCDDYLNYETTEDFIGKTSVGGFALRDDEDDAYDNTTNGRPGGKPSRDMLGDEYNTEIYEHRDSDNEESAGDVTFDPSRAQLNDRGLLQRKTDLSGVLSSWANTSSNTTKAAALMSNGKPPLEGFVLGGSINSHKKRYPGPDMPRDYITKRHIFGENEHPLIFQTIARAVKLQEKEQHRQKMNQKVLPPLTGSKNFVNLALAMKNRFTTSKTEETKVTGRAGLYKPDPLVAKRQRGEDTSPTNVPTAKKPIVLKRTVQTFLPHPLLCKRFGVPVPKNAVGISMNSSMISSNQPSRVTEANYFETEIMSVRENKKVSKQEKVRDKKKASDKANPDMDMEQDPDGLQRPSMEKLKSIFEANSDTDSSTDLDASSDEDEEQEERPGNEMMQRAKDIVANAVAMGGERPSSETSRPMPGSKEDNDNNKDDMSSSASSADSRRRERRSKRKSHRKHSSRRRKRSRSPDADDVDHRRPKERRRKHDRKHKKKKSSRHKRDKDV
ncbi:unnamed protein product [Cylindrotheca closterium]|uniref:G patch domain-containing protein n=1 Tax=Cylindrotheca closterium TaxID=2856 RepID=A0AAD2FME5_9STRA|nr:unnamed protein product [Cylindrotheca closterium]